MIITQHTSILCSYQSPHLFCVWIDSETGQMQRHAWSPDGTLLAVPMANNNNEIMILDAKKGFALAFILKGAHTKPASVLAWSRNGLYLVCSYRFERLPFVRRSDSSRCVMPN